MAGFGFCEALGSVGRFALRCVLIFGFSVAGFRFCGGSYSGFWFCGGFGFVVGLMDGLGFAVGLDLGFEGVGGFGLSVVSTAPVGFGGHGIGGFAIADHKFGRNVNSISGFCE